MSASPRPHRHVSCVPRIKLDVWLKIVTAHRVSASSQKSREISASSFREIPVVVETRESFRSTLFLHPFIILHSKIAKCSEEKF